MNCRVLHTGAASAQDNMSCDARLLKDLDNDFHITLHHYEWQAPALTYGYFVNPNDYLSAEGLQKWTLDTARRPTGGGIILHTCDLAFSVLIPATHRAFSHNTLTNYAYVNSMISRAIERFCEGSIDLVLLPKEAEPTNPTTKRFCMAHPTRFDVMLDGRKVGGAAQRRTRAGLLHQGSVCLTLPTPEFLEDLLLEANAPIACAMQRESYPLLGTHASEKELREARGHLRALIGDAINELL